jgi:hypothetical protein
LADVCLEEENIRALHAGVEDLGSGHLLRVFPPYKQNKINQNLQFSPHISTKINIKILFLTHNCAASLNTRQIVKPRDIHHQSPILLRMRIDLNLI